MPFLATVASGLCPPTLRKSIQKAYYVITRDLHTFSRPKQMKVDGDREGIIVCARVLSNTDISLLCHDVAYV